MVGKGNARSMRGCGPDRARREAAAAIRADILQMSFNAVRAEGAFIGADAGVRGVRWQIAIAIFTVRTKLERHGTISPQNTVRDKAIRLTFPAKGAGGAVARHKGHVIAERPEFRRDGFNQLFRIAFREIRPAD